MAHSLSGGFPQVYCSKVTCAQYADWPAILPYMGPIIQFWGSQSPILAYPYVSNEKNWSNTLAWSFPVQILSWRRVEVWRLSKRLSFLSQDQYWIGLFDPGWRWDLPFYRSPPQNCSSPCIRYWIATLEIFQQMDGLVPTRSSHLPPWCPNGLQQPNNCLSTTAVVPGAPDPGGTLIRQLLDLPIPRVGIPLQLT